jgi:hypothetical protein
MHWISGSDGCAGRDQGPGTFLFHDPGEVEEEGILVVTADHLEPDR